MITIMIVTQQKGERMSVKEIVEEIKSKDSLPEYWDFKGNDQREHVHSMIKYPAVMVPNMQGEIFDIILRHDNTISNVLDPFMGSGTILVEGCLRGLDVIGIDINPLSFLAVKVKLQRYAINTLQNKSKDLIKRIQNDSSTDCFEFDNIQKWYKKDIIKSLSKIRRCIMLETDKKYRQLFWVTFAEIAKQADNSRTSTFKLHIKEQRRIDDWNYDCIEKFKFKLLENITALKDFKEMQANDICDKKVTVKYGDSLKLLADKRCFKDGSVDLVITSPPYGDNATTITYGQFSVLPLKWIPLEDIDSKKISNSVIETLSKIDSDSLGGRNYTVQSIIDSELYSYSQPFSQLYNQLTDAMQIDKARKVASFFLDFEKIITSLYKIVKENKFMVFTVGNRHVNKLEVPFDEILETIAEHYGFDVVYDFRRNILKNKNYSDTKAQNFKTIKKETILVLQKRSKK
ncbi:MAG: hypothetical protein EGR86_00835 [Ruminiclostridium sp.]|nr:hypothetical protein [Ruminiclostridium sp.]